MRSLQFSFSQRMRPRYKVSLCPSLPLSSGCFLPRWLFRTLCIWLLKTHPTLTFAERGKCANEGPTSPTPACPFCFSSICLGLQLQGPHIHTQVCECLSSNTGASKELFFHHHQARDAVSISDAVTGKIDPYKFWKQVQTFKKNIWGLRYLRHELERSILAQGGYKPLASWIYLLLN